MIDHSVKADVTSIKTLIKSGEMPVDIAVVSRTHFRTKNNRSICKNHLSSAIVTSNVGHILMCISIE